MLVPGSKSRHDSGVVSQDEQSAEAHNREFEASDGWSARYRSGDTPWDQGEAHPELVRRAMVDGLVPKPGAGDLDVFVPGCGRGHDALWFARAGCRVTAVDFASGLAAGLGPALEALGSRFVETDALTFEGGPFDLVFEHTFHCAIPPERREDWARLVDRVLRPGGRLAALVFPADKPTSEGGPPHRTTVAGLAASLGSGFRTVVDEPVERGIATRAWAERWAVFEKVDG